MTSERVPFSIRDPLSGKLNRRGFIAGALSAFAWLRMDGTASARDCGTAPRWPPPFGHPEYQSIAPGSDTSPPRETRVEGVNHTYRYSLDGVPKVIRGMGYNPRLASLPIADRRDRLSRDFALMRQNGVNTVFGWDPVEFDGLLLDIAEEIGIGVAIPFEIDFTLDYRDPETQRTTVAQILDMVSAYRSHPAVRMWAIWNELFQRTVPPAWCVEPMSNDSHELAEALADMLVLAADAARAADPLHVVLYREAEDAYTGWIADALTRQPASRPWLVIGINVYNERLAEILSGWPARNIDAAVLVSEFAMYNAPRGSRGEGLRWLWSIIRQHHQNVIGGTVYVWYTDGPESVDQVYGLVDSDGRPVDDALEVLGALYRA